MRDTLSRDGATLFERNGCGVGSIACFANRRGRFIAELLRNDVPERRVDCAAGGGDEEECDGRDGARDTEVVLPRLLRRGAVSVSSYFEASFAFRELRKMIPYRRSPTYTSSSSLLFVCFFLLT